MEIGALSTALSTINTQSEVGTRVLAMGLDEMQDQGEGMRKMMEMAVTPYVGGNFDASV